MEGEQRAKLLQKLISKVVDKIRTTNDKLSDMGTRGNINVPIPGKEEEFKQLKQEVVSLITQRESLMAKDIAQQDKNSNDYMSKKAGKELRTNQETQAWINEEWNKKNKKK